MRDRNGAAGGADVRGASPDDRPGPDSGPGGDPGSDPGGGTVLLLAAACGVVVANLYVAQPLIGLIGPELGLDAAAGGLVVTLAQLGYVAGLLLLVPLGDLVENRRLVTATLAAAVLALAVAALSNSAATFLAASLLVGVGSSAVQMLVPIAAHLATDAARGRVVGNVMAGLVLGILLARPASGLLADALGWRAVFGVASALTGTLALLLAWRLPQRRPAPGIGYGVLLRSLPPMLRDTPVLRRRSAYQAALFAGFSLFWTAVPLHLAGPTFGLSQGGIALFAVAGAAGALAAPVAGRLADHGWTRAGTGVAQAMVLAAFLLAWIGSGSLPALVAAGVLLDLGVQANLVFGQRLIYGLGSERRSRLNGLHMATFFLGGAAGSALAGVLMAHAGWEAAAALGAAMASAALLLFATEFRRERGSRGQPG